MEWFLVAAALACNPGDRLIDLSSKIPRGLKSMDFVVSVEPFYARFYIYQPAALLRQQTHLGYKSTYC